MLASEVSLAVMQEGVVGTAAKWGGQACAEKQRPGLSPGPWVWGARGWQTFPEKPDAHLSQQIIQ